MRATDTTSPGLQFELHSESSPGTFVIDSDSGRITVAKPLDREKVAMYSFQLVVTEVLIGPVTAPARLVRALVDVMILDENDNRPQCNEGADLVKYVLVGNYSFNNSLKIADIMCTDFDEGRNAEITLTSMNLPRINNGEFILNTEASSGEFTLNTTTSKVIFIGILLRNANYPITIRASDHGNPPLSTLVNITVIVMGEKQEFTSTTQFLSIIIPSIISGELLLCACLIMLSVYCYWHRRRIKAKNVRYDINFVICLLQ